MTCKINQKTWKYLSFGLIGVLVFGVTVLTLPQGYAQQTEGVLAILQDIREKITNVNDKVVQKNGVFLLENVEIPDGEEVRIQLIETPGDTVYVGTVNFGFAAGLPDRVILDCGLAGGILFDTGNGRDEVDRRITMPFACSSLTLRLFDFVDDSDDFFQVQVIAGYEEIPTPLHDDND